MPTKETPRRVGKITLPDGTEYRLVLAGRDEPTSPPTPRSGPPRRRSGYRQDRRHLDPHLAHHPLSGGEGDDLWIQAPTATTPPRMWSPSLSGRVWSWLPTTR